MHLYCVLNQKEKTYSHPMLVAHIDIAKKALKELNPENYEDLHIFQICELKDISELFQLEPMIHKQLSSEILTFLTPKESSASTLAEDHGPVGP